jgi:hypothetical protein
MRRALVDIVPDELLNRKRKAFVARGPSVAIAAEWPHLLELTRHMLLGSLEIADSTRFAEALQKARQGMEVPVVTIMRTLGIEIWLRKKTQQKRVHDDKNCRVRAHAQSQGKHRYDGKTGTLPKQPQSIPHVLK